MPATSLVAIDSEHFAKDGQDVNEQIERLFSNATDSLDSQKSEASTKCSLNYSEDVKIGVLQEFIKSKGPVENFSSDLFTVDNVHAIATLDLRMLNLDRNECNLLVTS